LPWVNSHLEQNNGLGPERDLKAKLYHIAEFVKLTRVGAPQQSYKRERLALSSIQKM
jgi:hypothetical protein